MNNELPSPADRQTAAIHARANSEGNYGSDQNGMICGFLFEADAPGRAVDSPLAVAWLKQDAAATGSAFLWLHFNLANSPCERWLRNNIPLPEQFYETLHEGSHSTRIEFADGSLVAVANDVLFDFAFDASHISTLYLSVDKRALITARSKPLRAIDRLREATRSGTPFRSSVELLIHLLHDQGDVLTGIVRDSITKVDEIEDQMLAGRLDQKRASLGQLRRVLVRLKRLLAPEPAALFRLLSSPPAWMRAEDVADLRHSTEEFSIAVNDIDSLQERIKLLQEEIAAQIQEENNKSLFLLTTFTVLALPVNMIAGLFGMNVGGIPFNQDPEGFWIVVGVVLTITSIFGWWAFRRGKD
jgi:zinc transporter